MPMDARKRLKTLLRGVVRSKPVRRISHWLHAESDPEPEAEPAESRAEACFIHIPKTGGTFVTQAESRNQAIVSPMRDLNHATLVDQDWQVLRDIPPPFFESNAVPLSAVDGHVLFSNARNIFSFFVSYFHHAGGHVEKYRNPHHYDFGIANRGFDYLIKTISDRAAIWPSRKLVHYQLFSQPSGRSGSIAPRRWIGICTPWRSISVLIFTPARRSAWGRAPTIGRTIRMRWWKSSPEPGAESSSSSASNSIIPVRSIRRSSWRTE